MSHLKNLILLGAPGGGKGTIAKKIMKDFPFASVSTGDLIRKQVHDNTELGKTAKKYMGDGKLVPDILVVQVVADEIDRMKKQKTNILLDGFPRTLNQAKVLSDSGTNIDLVVNLEIPHQTIMNRMSQRWIHFPSGRTYAYDYNPPKKAGFDDVTGEPLSQREDDKPEVVKARLDLYEKTTKPLLNYYSTFQSNKVESFSGTESDIIYPQVKKWLQDHLKFVI